MDCHDYDIWLVLISVPALFILKRNRGGGMKGLMAGRSKWLVFGFFFVCNLAVVGVSSPTALAFSGSGTGTSGDPFQITTCAQLNSIDDDLTADYVLTGDIDCSGAAALNSGAGWAPIGSSGGGFQGSLDGQGRKINHLDLSTLANSTNLAGMFGYLSGSGVVKNVSILDSKMNGGHDVGMVAGGLYDSSSLDNVYVNATVTCHGENCAGMVGNMHDSTLINNSGADVTVTGDSQSVGGLVGWIAADGAIQESYANGYVSGTLYIGGLVGAVNNIIGPAVINNSYSSATVVASSDYAGGLAGLGAELNVTNSYAVGSVSGGDSVGGLVGLFFGFMGNAFSAEKITGTGGAVGPVTGHFAGGSVGNRFFDTNITGFSSSPDGSSPISDSNYFKDNSTNQPFDQWDFSTIWRTNYQNYPSLTPKVDPYMLCEAPGSTDTSITGRCIVEPLGWGTPTWEARWSRHAANDWHAITLGDTHQASATVTGLTPGTWYDLQFRFTNDFGTGPWGTLLILTTGTAPSVATPTVTTAHKTGYVVPIQTTEDIATVTTNPDKGPITSPGILLPKPDTTEPTSGQGHLVYYVGGVGIFVVLIGVAIRFWAKNR